MKKLKKFYRKLVTIGLSMMLVASMSFFTELNVEAASNPYPSTQDVDRDGYYEIPCTYFAWQQVYDNLGVALPSWGNAVNWWNGARNGGIRQVVFRWLGQLQYGQAIIMDMLRM